MKRYSLKNTEYTLHIWLLMSNDFTSKISTRGVEIASVGVGILGNPHPEATKALFASVSNKLDCQFVLGCLKYLEVSHVGWRILPSTNTRWRDFWKHLRIVCSWSWKWIAHQYYIDRARSVHRSPLFAKLIWIILSVFRIIKLKVWTVHGVGLIHTPHWQHLNVPIVPIPKNSLKFYPIWEICG